MSTLKLYGASETRLVNVNLNFNIDPPTIIKMI